MGEQRPKIDLKPLFQQALFGLGKVGARAFASAAKSVVKDGKKLAKELDRRARNMEETLSMMADDVEDDEIKVKRE